MILKTLGVVAKDNTVDTAFILFYISIVISIFNNYALVISLLSSILIVFKKEYLKPKTTEDEKIISKIEQLESEVSAMRIGHGMKVLK